MKCIVQNTIREWSFWSKKGYSDPFNDICLYAIFRGPDGSEKVVPAFWAGDNIWRVRFSSPITGEFQYQTVCSDKDNADLQGLEGEFMVVPYKGSNPLFLHGPVQISSDQRYFQHRDGTPFFWLGDTWWMGTTKRLTWPVGFQTLALDRVEKGYNIVQIVAGGLYPDMPPFDERGANEAGFPWKEDYSTINPEYFDYADRRMDYLVEIGIMPCIFACWGYFLKFMGIEKMKQHWRNIVARYGAYPVVWCLAGEGAMPYYLSETKEQDTAMQKAGWTELAEYLRAIDPFRRPIAIHPTVKGRDEVDDPSVLDFEMLQTGHSDRESLQTTVETAVEAYNREPRMPVINSEVCYEGIGHACREEVQRMMFWTSFLCGTVGHTYGANGIWQVNTRERPYGPSPPGMSWGNTPWEEACKLPGSVQLGMAQRLIERYEWWKFEPHPEWIDPHWSSDDYLAPYAAGIPGKVRMIYFPPSWWGVGTVKSLEQGARYRAYLFNPADGSEIEIGSITPDENGDWEPPLGNPPSKLMPIFQDWVLVLESIEAEYGGPGFPSAADLQK